MAEEVTVFSYLTDISKDKTGELKDKDNLKNYIPWLINRYLSSSIETINNAMKMNELYHLEKDMQYDYMLHAISKRKRFFKWHKKQKMPDFAMKYCHIYNMKYEDFLFCWNNLFTDSERNEFVKTFNNVYGK